MLLITQPRTGAYGEILALQSAASDKGWDVFSPPTGWRLTEEMITSGVKGVPYGSQTFCEVIAQQMNWTLKYNQFDWLAKLPEYYLKRKVEFMTLAEAKLLKETKFIKPADDKVFTAGVYTPSTLITNEMILADTPTLVSDVVEFDLEYRCFVDGKRVTTWSNYICYDHVADSRYWNMVDMSEEHYPFDLVNDLIHTLSYHDFGLPEVAPSVIDVGRIKGKGMAIIETNQVWASGIYGCDPGGVLRALEMSCE